MLRQGITRLLSIPRCNILSKAVYASHTGSCPVADAAPDPGEASPTGGGGGRMGPAPRALRSGKCRMGFIPEEWFTFFHVKTGVSGPYVFGIVMANYILSKEILVMEHEYYGGLSWILVIYFVSTRFGPKVGAVLDKQVDAVVDEWESGRKRETAMYEDIIKSSEKAIWMAEGQQGLMEAKKENVAMQLEAEYRERCMMVYQMVKGRMDYHVKRYFAEARIQQKWMIDWILKEVMESITPEFERQALDTAIADLSEAASRVQ